MRYSAIERLMIEGYLWWRSTTSWSILRRITGAGKLIDVQGEPTLHQGADGDVAVSPRGTCWSKKAGPGSTKMTWAKQSNAVSRTESLVVLGNLSLPIVDGKIPLYHPVRTTQIVGYLEVKPING